MPVSYTVRSLCAAVGGGEGGVCAVQWTAGHSLCWGAAGGQGGRQHQLCCVCTTASHCWLELTDRAVSAVEYLNCGCRMSSFLLVPSYMYVHVISYAIDTVPALS